MEETLNTYKDKIYILDSESENYCTNSEHIKEKLIYICSDQNCLYQTPFACQ